MIAFPRIWKSHLPSNVKAKEIVVVYDIQSPLLPLTYQNSIMFISQQRGTRFIPPSIKTLIVHTRGDTGVGTDSYGYMQQ